MDSLGVAERLSDQIVAGPFAVLGTCWNPKLGACLAWIMLDHVGSCWTWI